MLDEDFAS